MIWYLVESFINFLDVKVHKDQNDFAHVAWSSDRWAPHLPVLALNKNLIILAEKKLSFDVLYQELNIKQKFG